MGGKLNRNALFFIPIQWGTAQMRKTFRDLAFPTVVPVIGTRPKTRSVFRSFLLLIVYDDIIIGQPHVNEEKENVKKAAVAPKRQIVNQNRVPSRRTAQHRGTYSLRKTPPMYVPAWRRNVRIDNNKNSLAKVGSSSLRDEVMKESVKDTSKASSRKLPISQNSAAHAKRAGLVCNVARIPARKKSLSGKKDFSANALPLNRSQNTSSKADLMEKPKRQCQSELSKTFAKSAFKLCKSHTESILDQSSPKTRIYYAGTISGAPLVESGSCGATVSFNPNVNSDFCRWTTSCAALIKTATPRGITPGISTARFRTKAAGCTTEKATPTDAGLNSQMDPQLITLSSDGKFVNDAPLESPLITADDEKHDSISEKFDQNTYDYYVPKIIADYLEVGCLP
ncbi:unnamed protein product [Toxocara canis]|uniref:Peroxide-inducible transcript 1 protein n=1 Tax=Toxocara canis TaxID=6265 RepID=A0A183TZL4_TOXCA|nr:unnamed protein product [Toxocara canis]